MNRTAHPHTMFVLLDGQSVPYPPAVLTGHLRMCGLTLRQQTEVMEAVAQRLTRGSTPLELSALNRFLEDELSALGEAVVRRWTMLAEFERRRRETGGPSPIVVALEGASATGKSMLALEVAADLSATRVIGTDSLRQVLRTIHSEDEHPELFCHTYEAHRYKQTGPSTLSPSVRGYLAQCDMIVPHLRNAVERILSEGLECVIDGVHVIPGSIQDAGASVIELVINPSEAIHRSMFMSKSGAGGLRTVTHSPEERALHFERAREIQDYLVHLAESAGVKAVSFKDYEQALREIRSAILTRIRELL
ncbi:MAG: hypothetical protein HXY34_07020 [Candidatus Thorarchaeota archaeon]|nr:hypothetical protein [Candidatus Thorarchaeota archaeon]